MFEGTRPWARWAAGFGGLVAAIALLSWLSIAPDEEGARPERLPAAPPTPSAPPTGTAPGGGSPAAPLPEAPAHRIAPGGRLAIDRGALPDEGPLALALELADEARGSGERGVRVVSVKGWKIETTASPLPGAGSGLRLELEPGMLTPGLYMIEVETAGAGALPLRRYVLEVR